MIHLEPFCRELSLAVPPQVGKSVSLRVSREVLIQLSEFERGISLFGVLANCPNQKREELFTYLMRANFLGQGTGGTRIGLNADENLLTLSWSFPYEMGYQEFKDCIEDFANYLLYWRKQIQEFK